MGSDSFIYLNESFFGDIDDEELSKAAVETVENDSTNAVQVGLDSYQHLIDVRIIGVPDYMRNKNPEVYASYLKPITKKLEYMLNHCDCIDKFGEPVYALMDLMFNINKEKDYHFRQYNVKKIEPQMNDVNGVKIYNDPFIMKKFLIWATNFNIKIGVNFDMREDGIGPFIHFLYKTVTKTIKMLFPNEKKMKVFLIKITDNNRISRTGKYFSAQMNEQTIIDISSRKREKRTVNALTKLYEVIFHKKLTSNSIIDNYFNNSEHSQDMLSALKILGIKDMNTVEVEEDDNNIIITIPENKKINFGWIYLKIDRLINVEQKCKRNVIIKVNGTIEFKADNKADINDKFISHIWPEVNCMKFTVEYTTMRTPVIDLTNLSIDKLTVVYPAIYSRYDI